MDNFTKFYPLNNKNRNLYKLLNRSIVAVTTYLILGSVTFTTAAPITISAENGRGNGFSFSWLHAGTSASGAFEGFYMNGSKSRFMSSTSPLTFTGEWDNSKLTIETTSQAGSIAKDIVDSGNTLVQKNDVFSFTGGVLEQSHKGSVRGYIEYELERAGSSVENGIFFVWPELGFAGEANSLTLGQPDLNGFFEIKLAAWTNNWINGSAGDWSFLEALGDFQTTVVNGITTDVMYMGESVALTTDGSRPGGNFIPLGMDLGATGITHAPEPSTYCLVLLGLCGVGIAKKKKRKKV